MERKNHFNKIIKIVLIIWLVLMIIISLGLILNKLGITDTIASKLKDNKYNDSIAKWEVESGLSKLSTNNSQYKATYSKLPSNIKIWDVEGTKIAYSNKIGSSDDYKGEFDLYIYDTESGKQEEILKLNNDNAIEKCVLDSKYIVWQDEKGSFFKNLDSGDEKVELPRMYQFTIDNNKLIYVDTNTLCTYDLESKAIIDEIYIMDDLFLHTKLVANNDLAVISSIEEAIVYNFKTKETKKTTYTSDELYRDITIIDNKVYFLSGLATGNKVMDENGELQEYIINTNNLSIDTSIFVSTKYLPLKSDTNNLKIIDVKNNKIIDMDISNIDNPNYSINIYEVYHNNILVIKSDESMKYADEAYLITITK